METLRGGPLGSAIVEDVWASVVLPSYLGLGELQAQSCCVPGAVLSSNEKASERIER